MLAVYLIRIAWVKVLGGGYLLYLVWEHFTQDGGAEARRTPPAARPAFGLSAFWATIVRVEMVNLVFSVDSILVAVAMSDKQWVVITGGVLGIVALRLVVGQLLSSSSNTRHWSTAPSSSSRGSAIKLLLEYLHHVHLVPFEIPKTVSLGLIIVIFLVCVLVRPTPGPPGTRGCRRHRRPAE